MRNFVALIRSLGPKGADGGSDFFEGGTVSEVRGSGNLSVQSASGSFEAFPVNDEAYAVGDKVWITKSENGSFIVHGKMR